MNSYLPGVGVRRKSFGEFSFNRDCLLSIGEGLLPSWFAGVAKKSSKARLLLNSSVVTVNSW